MRKFKKTIQYTFLLVIILIVGIFSVDYGVSHFTKKQIYTSVEEIPHNKVGLLLGTIKKLDSGYLNNYYKYRIEACTKLYKAGKIDFVLISGDNSRKDYDEPTEMKKDLIKNGIPGNRIYLDYAGFRTLDSVVRSKEIFGQNKVTIISQQFHNQRAVFIANFKNIEAVGFNAKDVSAYYGFKTMLREKLARVKMLLDLLFGKEPKFLGKKIEIN